MDQEAWEDAVDGIVFEADQIETWLRDLSARTQELSEYTGACCEERFAELEELETRIRHAQSVLSFARDAVIAREASGVHRDLS